jgi:endo-1,4-beta-xylanase
MGPAVDLTTLLTPGVAYDVSFDARIAADDASAGLGDNVHFTVDDGSYTWVSSGKDLSDSAWTTITGTYTLAAGATKANMYLDSTLPSGQTAYPDLLIDNVEITDPSGDGTTDPGNGCTYPSGANVISSGFESGDLDGWGPRDDGHGTATVAIVDGGHGSDHALEASARATQGQGIGHDVTCLLKPSTTYEFSGWVRFAAGQPTDEVWLSLANTAGGSTTYTTLGQFTNVSSSGWVQVDQKFTMPAASDSALLYLETKYYSDGSAGNTSDLLFDDLTVSTPSRSAPPSRTRRSPASPASCSPSTSTRSRPRTP